MIFSEWLALEEISTNVYSLVQNIRKMIFNHISAQQSEKLTSSPSDTETFLYIDRLISNLPNSEEKNNINTAWANIKSLISKYTNTGDVQSFNNEIQRFTPILKIALNNLEKNYNR